MSRVDLGHGERTPPSIEKVGAAIVRNNKVLVVRKEGQPSSEFFTAGGKIEQGETHYQTLVREVKEELGVDIRHSEYIGTFHDQAVFEEVPIIIYAYYVEVVGEPRPSAEISELKWIGRDDKSGSPISSIMIHQIIPELERLGRI